MWPSGRLCIEVDERLVDHLPPLRNIRVREDLFDDLPPLRDIRIYEADNDDAKADQVLSSAASHIEVFTIEDEAVKIMPRF